MRSRLVDSSVGVLVADTKTRSVCNLAHAEPAEVEARQVERRFVMALLGERSQRADDGDHVREVHLRSIFVDELGARLALPARARAVVSAAARAHDVEEAALGQGWLCRGSVL